MSRQPFNLRRVRRCKTRRLAWCSNSTEMSTGSRTSRRIPKNWRTPAACCNVTALSSPPFFLHYAKRAMRQEGRTAHVFGGLMRYEASALAAYRRQAAQTAAQQAESGAQQRRRRLDAYEAWLRLQLDALKETLPPEELEALREQARRQARSHQQVPSYLLTRQVEHEVETQLIQMHGLPSFEVWSAHDEMAAPPSSATQERAPSGG